MKWEIETWRKLYTRVDAAWLLLDLSARGLADELLKYADDAGYIELGLGQDATATTIADAFVRVLGAKSHERTRLRKDIAQLLAPAPRAPFLVQKGSGVRIRNFPDAQDRNGTKRASSAERMRRLRERERDVGDGKCDAGDASLASHVTRHGDARVTIGDASRDASHVTDPVPVPDQIPPKPPVTGGGGGAAAPGAAKGTPADELLRHYVDAKKKALPDSRPGALSDKDRRAINAKLRAGESLDDLKLCVEGLFLSPFHLGENDRKTKYLALEHALRDKNRDQFIQLALAAREASTGQFVVLGDGTKLPILSLPDREKYMPTEAEAARNRELAGLFGAAR